MLKVGIIGAGNMGNFLASSYRQIPEVKVAGVYDVSVDAARNLAEKHQAVSYQHVQDLLDDREINIITVCLPTSLHCEIVVNAAKHGKHVFCEKPIAGNLNDGRLMVQTCKDNKVKFMVGHVLRYFPEYRKAKELMDNGKVGRPAVVRCTRGGGFPRASQDWYAKYEMSGGLVLDMIIHDFDFLRWCFGPVERVYAKGLLMKKLDHIDYALVTLRFKNGVIAHVEGSWAHPGGFGTKLEIAGDKGMIHFNSREDSPLNLKVKDAKTGAGVAVPESPLKESPYTLELKHFVNCVQNNKEPEITGEDALAALEVSLAAIESIKSGEAVTL
ncbi:MAG: Gfo/Idh/MocA family oxidoreductase [Deltaproteobacteria bacterium]|nr:Gfo/Idh/MocA family oxidoreductase [Deltaproteobacteria bacterium]